MKEHEFWKERRHLEEMPFDKRFDKISRRMLVTLAMS